MIENDSCSLSSKVALLGVCRRYVQLSGGCGADASEGIVGEFAPELQDAYGRVSGEDEGNSHRLGFVTQRQSMSSVWTAPSLVLIFFPGVPGAGPQAGQQRQGDEN
ncbi:hypothetical protein [Streptomyces spinosisporus]|uniref:Uncharacterized protein n=1 Tax=Streptomyces spinosisporus TaxID=2927582 RepID=A0ABS9XNH8_9ACTN|nr:hypothetical protein [Streptomyces spinosisporus]MCI3243157.1 hypothetical protein [Streptomyces spinosisporus]